MVSLKYPATIESNGEGGFIASFRDVPEAITEAWSLDELQESARDALLTAMEFYVEDQKIVPLPSKIKKGDLVVSLSEKELKKVFLA